MPMTHQEVYTRVRGIIREQLDCAEEAVVEEASFVEDLGADSLALVELVLALEEQFSISVSDSDAEKLHTVGDAVAYIEGHVGASVSAAE